MNKLEQFKEFAREHKHLKNLVDSGKYTWQSLYEHYDIYGPGDSLFGDEEEDTKTAYQNVDSRRDNNEEKIENKKEGFGGFIDAISGLDVEKINDGLNGMKKILNILSEVTKPDEAPPLSKRKMSRPYQRSDD